MFEIEIQADKALSALDHIARGLSDATPLMRMIAGTLLAETQKNFAAGGRPAWLGLSPGTLKKRGAGAQTRSPQARG